MHCYLLRAGVYTVDVDLYTLSLITRKHYTNNMAQLGMAKELLKSIVHPPDFVLY